MWVVTITQQRLFVRLQQLGKDQILQQHQELNPKRRQQLAIR
jgi:hypothetical protein